MDTEQQVTLVNWRHAALCAQTDPELFFPGPGQTARAAKTVCGRCKVRSECRADALARGDVAPGVLGGLSPRQRRALLRTRNHQVTSSVTPSTHQ